MVEHVGSIDADLDALGFADPERLAHVSVEAPRAGSQDFVLTEVASSPRLGILKQNLSRLRICQRNQRAVGRTAREQVETHRIVVV